MFSVSLTSELLAVQQKECTEQVHKTDFCDQHTVMTTRIACKGDLPIDSPSREEQKCSWLLNTDTGHLHINTRTDAQKQKSESSSPSRACGRRRRSGEPSP